MIAYVAIAIGRPSIEPGSGIALATLVDSPFEALGFDPLRFNSLRFDPFATLGFDPLGFDPFGFDPLSFDPFAKFPVGNDDVPRRRLGTSLEILSLEIFAKL
jgi:hypothetical protein